MYFFTKQNLALRFLSDLVKASVCTHTHTLNTNVTKTHENVDFTRKNTTFHGSTNECPHFQVVSRFPRLDPL